MTEFIETSFTFLGGRFKRVMDDTGELDEPIVRCDYDRQFTRVLGATACLGEPIILERIIAQNGRNVKLGKY